VRAWLLEWPSQPLALAPAEVIEVVYEPEVHRVPVGPDWCRWLVYWRDRLLPLALPSRGALDSLSVVVIAYQQAPRAPLEHAAIAVRGTPRQIEVPRDADCDPPNEGVLAEPQVRACFLHENRPIVVPELRALFASAISGTSQGGSP